jgi:hypothetical protein
MLSERARRILGLIAEGRSYDQILQQHPELTYFDIFAAAREALELVRPTPPEPMPVPSPPPSLPVELLPLPTPHQKPPSFVERARARHGRAFTRWSREEDARLEQLFRAGTPRSEIVRLLDRHEGAIERRLEKLGLIEAPERPEPRSRRDRERRSPERRSVESTQPDKEAADRPTVPGWELFRDRLSDEPPIPE